MMICLHLIEKRLQMPIIALYSNHKSVEYILFTLYLRKRIYATNLMQFLSMNVLYRFIYNMEMHAMASQYIYISNCTQLGLEALNRSNYHDTHYVDR